MISYFCKTLGDFSFCELLSDNGSGFSDIAFDESTLTLSDNFLELRHIPAQMWQTCHFHDRLRYGFAKECML